MGFQMTSKPVAANKVGARRVCSAKRVGPVKVQARTDLGGPYGNGTECVRLADRTIPEGKAKVPLELEGGEKPPMNLYKNKEPYVGRVESVERIVGPDSPGETCHIIVNHDGNMPYWEGQSYGVIPPGTKINSKGKEVPHGVRLYSIASTRYGDNYDGKTASFSVRRATYVDPDTGKEDPEKRGICSNFLCDADPGAEVKLTGPTGTQMLMPEDPSTPMIMIATGTGIAPYRAFLRRCFLEDVPNWRFTGLAWLFMGCANSASCLYDDELQEILKRHSDQFRLDYALSREQTNKRGGKMYIQDRVEEYKDQIFQLLDEGAHIYFCGLKGMMPGIQEMLQNVCAEKGLTYEDWQKRLKESGQWHVEVY